MHLTIFLPTLAGGGAERVMLNLAHGFLESGHRVDVVVNHSEGALQHAVPRDARLFVLRASGIPVLALRLIAYLRREEPDGLITALDDANVAALMAALPTGYHRKTVCSVHNTVSKHYSSYGTFRSTIILFLSRFLYPRARAIIAVSEGVATDLCSLLRLPKSHITVIPNPVLTPDIERLAGEPVDHPWFAPGSPPVVLACGRLTVQKDYPTLLRAFAHIRHLTDARLLILGEGEQRQALAALAAELGIDARVGFPGYVANPYAMMSRCSVYVLSSLFEGSPVVLVEALKCGCRIVSTDCPSGPRETLRGVPAATLVPVGDVGALASGISAFLLSSDPPPGPRHLHRFDYRVAANAYLAAAIETGASGAQRVRG